MGPEQITVEKVWFEAERIFVLTTDGKKASHPLAWFPRLQNASEKERSQFELSPFGIHWPLLDEDLSFEGFFHYAPKGMKSK